MSYLRLNSPRMAVESTLMGSTTVSASANWSQSSRMSHSSAVQVLVKARGKKASSTFFPRRDDNVTAWPEVEARVKSGAWAPTGGTVWDMGRGSGVIGVACTITGGAACV